MKTKTIVFILIVLLVVIIPSTIGKNDNERTDLQQAEDYTYATNGVEIIRPKPGHLYLFDILEIPIASQHPIIIGDITCVAEQVPVYPFTVRWEFVDWQYGFHNLICDNVSSSYWRCTYTNFNFGTLQISAVFKNVGGTVMSSDVITTKKFG